MFWLATQMWLLLITAFGLGLGLGWWLWANHVSAKETAPASAGADGAHSLDRDAREPLRYREAINGNRDDLTQIIGIDTGAAAKLNDAGIYFIAQIAAWERPQAMWVEDRFDEPGRVHHERWVEQAQTLGQA